MFGKLQKAAMGAALVAITIVAAPSSASAGTAATDLANFRVGIQVIDAGKAGQTEFTPYASFGNGCSPWAGDSNTYDPDGASIALENAPRGRLIDKDFRIGVRAADHNGSSVGALVWSPWASQGGGVSPYALDGNGYDPDQFQVCIEVRTMPAGVSIYDFRLSVKVVDHGTANQGGFRQFTPWAYDGGGSSPFAFDPNSYDPDGIAVGIEVY